MPVNRTVAGIPVYMLRQLPWLWFRYWWCRLVRRDVLQVWKTGRELYEFMGRMREHKLMLEDGTLRRGALRVRAESPFGAQSNG